MDLEWTDSTYTVAAIIYIAFGIGCLCGILPKLKSPTQQETVAVSIKLKPKKKKKKRKRSKPKPEAKPEPEPEPEAEVLILTASEIIEDAISLLRSLGHAKKEVESVVKELAAKERYESVERLIKDVYKKHS